ncbi:MAG: hypothetical protein K9L30_17435 [Desulfobacterales bacterium]|nr:hypothetical protein [Desulfobacterales bacterium]
MVSIFDGVVKRVLFQSSLEGDKYDAIILEYNEEARLKGILRPTFVE